MKKIDKDGLLLCELQAKVEITKETEFSKPQPAEIF